VIDMHSFIMLILKMVQTSDLHTFLVFLLWDKVNISRFLLAKGVMEQSDDGGDWL
jgi:hypothetical protein